MCHRETSLMLLFCRKPSGLPEDWRRTRLEASWPGGHGSTGTSLVEIWHEVSKQQEEQLYESSVNKALLEPCWCELRARRKNEAKVSQKMRLVYVFHTWKTEIIWSSLFLLCPVKVVVRLVWICLNGQLISKLFDSLVSTSMLTCRCQQAWLTSRGWTTSTETYAPPTSWWGRTWLVRSQTLA